jgi:hypothetical protein
MAWGDKMPRKQPFVPTFCQPEMTPIKGSQVCPKGNGFLTPNQTARQSAAATIPIGHWQQQHRNVLNCACQLPCMSHHTLAAAPSVTPFTTLIPPLLPHGCRCRDDTAPLVNRRTGAGPAAHPQRPCAQQVEQDSTAADQTTPL